jgi:hypothetical protein
MAVLLLGLSALPAFAQNENVMNVHVDKAVAIPGKVLPPGDYVFRLADSVTRPADVQVMSADGKTEYGFIPVYSAYRTAGSDTEVTTTPPDNFGIACIDSWYFPGEQDGYRFIYSKTDLRKIDMIAQQMNLGGAQAGMP